MTPRKVLNPPQKKNWQLTRQEGPLGSGCGGIRTQWKSHDVGRSMKPGGRLIPEGQTLMTNQARRSIGSRCGGIRMQWRFCDLGCSMTPGGQLTSPLIQRINRNTNDILGKKDHQVTWCGGVRTRWSSLRVGCSMIPGRGLIHRGTNTDDLQGKVH